VLKVRKNEAHSVVFCVLCLLPLAVKLVCTEKEQHFEIIVGLVKKLMQIL